MPGRSTSAGPTASRRRSLTPIAGVEIEARADGVWVRSAAPLRVLASAVSGGDLETTRHVVNMRVGSDYHSDDPGRDLAAFARGLGIAEPFVGLMTAAATEAARIVWDEADGIRVGVVATVGLRVSVAAGVTPPVAWQPSTINVIALLDASLDRAAAVNGVITVTEAKVGALVDAGLLTEAGVQATGTVTDAVAVAWTGRGPHVPYLGPGTAVGFSLARAVRRAVLDGARWR